MINTQNFSAHGGSLSSLYEKRDENRCKYGERMSYLPRISLTDRQLCDLELILNGGFSPLSGFQNQEDYLNILNKIRLTNGLLWPIPVCLDVPVNHGLKKGQEVLLCDSYNKPLVVLAIESIYAPDKKKEAKVVYGTTDPFHFGVNYLLNETKEVYIGGKIHCLDKIDWFDFPKLRNTPVELRQWFTKNKWKTIVAFQTRNPIHQAHFWLVKNAADSVKGNILIHPVVGLTKDGDIDYVTRVKCYRYVIKKFPKGLAKLSLLPLAMRMAGPKEALLHAIVRKNYGCTHLIIGRSHADPGVNGQGKPYYDPYEAQVITKKYEKELGISILTSPEMVYEEKRKKYITVDKIRSIDSVQKLSGTMLRQLLMEKKHIPDGFSFPEVIRILRKKINHYKGVMLFFTGLPCSGKTTITRQLANLIVNKYDRQVTILDGDIVRKFLSKELGFSKKDRITNIRRIGYVGSEIVRHGGIVATAALAPYKSVRDEVREMVNKNGVFVEIYLSTKIAVCKERDTKGMYKKAELGLIKNFTGVNDVYEKPLKPEIILDTGKTGVLECAIKIMDYLKLQRLI